MSAFDTELYDSEAEQAYWEEVQEFEHRDDDMAEAAAYEDQRAFEIWADDMILDDENADVSEAAYLAHLEGFFPPD